MRRYSLDEKFTRYIMDKFGNSAVLAAEHIGCHPETIRRACRKYGITLQKGRKTKGKDEVRKKWSKFQRWLDENKEVKLEKTIAEVARKSKCSYKTVWMYFYNRRQRAKSILERQPWTTCPRHKVLQDINGSRLPVGSFERVQGFVERPTGKIKLIVHTYTGEKHIFMVTYEQLIKLNE